MTGNNNRLDGLFAQIESNISTVTALAVIGLAAVLILFSDGFAGALTRSMSALVSSAADLITAAAGNTNGSIGLIKNGSGEPAGSFYSFKFILWATVVTFLTVRPKGRKSLYLFLLLTAVIIFLNIIRLALFSLLPLNSNIFTSGVFSLPYRIVLFLLPLAFYFSSGAAGEKPDFSLLKAWRDNHFIIFVLAAIAGSLPGLLYGTGFFLFEWVINIVFFMSKAMLALFSVEASFTGRYLSNDHTIIFMSDSCAGLKVIIMFATLVFAGRGKAAHKLIAVAAGIFFLLFLNAIRVMILFEINNERLAPSVFDWWHSNFKYLFYIAVAAMWMVWLRWRGEFADSKPELTHIKSDIELR